jgi:hypothetical protein
MNKNLIKKTIEKHRIKEDEKYINDCFDKNLFIDLSILKSSLYKEEYQKRYKSFIGGNDYDRDTYIRTCLYIKKIYLKYYDKF